MVSAANWSTPRLFIEEEEESFKANTVYEVDAECDCARPV
jgi:hypothetical protein